MIIINCLSWGLTKGSDPLLVYDHYKDDLHYQASMFESSFGDGYGVGHKEGEAIGEVKGEAKATRQMVFNMAKKELPIEIIAGISGLTEKEVKLILDEL